MPIQSLLHNALTWVQSLGAVGAIAFIGIYSLATVLFVPGSILTLGAGIVFGVVAGSIYVFVGATIGATLAFLIGRYFARDWVARRIAKYEKFTALDRAIAKEGFKIVFLTRLSPVFPFNLLNYGLGVTQLSLKDYVVGCLGMIPGTIMYVYIGSLGSDLALMGTPGQVESAQAAQWIIRVIGFVATVAVTVYVTRVATVALQKSVDVGRVSDSPTDSTTESVRDVTADATPDSGDPIDTSKNL